MKSILNTNTLKLLVLACLLLLSGCESFTEVDMPQTQLTGTSVFSEVSTANAALADIYARIRETGMVSGQNTGLSSLMGNYSDEMDFYGQNNALQQFSNHTLVPSNTLVAGLWNDTYGQIYAANALMEGVQNSSAITGEDRDRLIGESLFIRAYLHSYLVNIFGEVPYITTTDYTLNAVATKLSQQLVWQSIKVDLMQSESLLPDTYPSAEHIRPNKAVATALLARVALYTEDWAQAETSASAVINNPLYSWEENLSDVFLKDSPETIWSLHPGITGLNTKDARTFIFSGGPPIKSALSQNLLSAFEPGDLRKDAWTQTITNGSESWSYAFKYKETTNTGTSVEYTILFRMAEQYLIRAEARAHLGNIAGAQQDINKIRTRAGLSNTTANTSQTLIDAVIQERRIELFLEQGHRWFDLKRTGRADSVLSAIKPQWQDTDVLLPLPENEILRNGNLLPQNPGY